MIDPLLVKTREAMKKAIEVTTNDLSTLRSGRATPSLIENIIVTAYEGTQRLKIMEMGTISAQDAKTLVISPYDPSQIPNIEKAIREGHGGLNPSVDSDVIRINLPALSEERRREYIKLAGAKIEAGKVMVRQVRQDAMKDLKKMLTDKAIGEDEEKTGGKKVQEITDQMVNELDVLGKKKEAELLQL